MLLKIISTLLLCFIFKILSNLFENLIFLKDIFWNPLISTNSLITKFLVISPFNSNSKFVKENMFYFRVEFKKPYYGIMQSSPALYEKDNSIIKYLICFLFIES